MAHIGGAVFGMLTARLFEQQVSPGAEVEG
jgi:hypothetical protein